MVKLASQPPVQVDCTDAGGCSDQPDLHPGEVTIVSLAEQVAEIIHTGGVLSMSGLTEREQDANWSDLAGLRCPVIIVVVCQKDPPYRTRPGNLVGGRP